MQAKFTGAGVTTVLTTFHQHQGKGNYQALEAIAEKCHDDTIKQYCIKDDPKFLLQAQLPATVQPEPEIKTEPSPKPQTVEITKEETSTKVETSNQVETSAQDNFQLDHEKLGRDSGLGLEPILGGQTAPLIHDEFTQPEETVVTPQPEDESQPTAVVMPEPPQPPVIPDPPQVPPVPPQPPVEPPQPPVIPEPPQPPVEPPVEPPVVNPPQPEPEVLAPERSEWLATVPRRAYNEWRPRVAELLPRSQYDQEANERKLEEMANKIDDVLREFGVKAKVNRKCYVPGPVITRFVLQLGYGETTKAIERIVGEMPRKLGVDLVRFTASNVSLEVPNKKRQTIALGDVLVSTEFAQSQAALPLALGLAPDGTPVVRDLVEGGPHLLVAGTTGAGKSVGLNAILLSLIAKHSPQELRLIIIDPKREFQAYEKLPHMLVPPIKDVTVDAMTALRWCIAEMERRYKLFDDVTQTSSMKVYNDFITKERAHGHQVQNYFIKDEKVVEYLEPLPRIVVLIDEFNDLMAQTRAGGRSKGSEFENLIAQLAGKCRAAGIHLIFATQSPRANVVTGLIKSNLPARIAFKVSDYHESQIILDEHGAEMLLGRGDMLHRFSNETTHRAHGAYVTEQDIKSMIDAWHQRYGDPEYVPQLCDSDAFVDPDVLEQLVEQAKTIIAAAQAQRLTERDLRHRLELNSLTAQKVMAKLKEQGLL